MRLYNPLVPRGVRALNFLTEFARVNRRMHNKSFTADNQATIVGGRNIGNEYFAAGSGLAYTDLDVLATGAVVQDVSTEFDVYWNSASAYPARDVIGPPAADSADAAGTRSSMSRMPTPRPLRISRRVRATPIVRELLDQSLRLDWTSAQLVYDDPAKTQGQNDRLLFPQLLATMGPAAHELDFVSPYFVPGEGGTASLVAAAARGVKVRILTNSLSSTDAPVVHAGYVKRRRELLRAGIQLYEMKASVGETRPEGAAERDTDGSSGLHAKTFAVDGERLFVGSFNLDQRSAHLNTEMGVVIDTPLLAHRLATTFETVVPLHCIRSATAARRSDARLDRAYASRRDPVRRRAEHELAGPLEGGLPVAPSDRLAAVGDSRPGGLEHEPRRRVQKCEVGGPLGPDNEPGRHRRRAAVGPTRHGAREGSWQEHRAATTRRKRRKTNARSRVPGRPAGSARPRRPQQATASCLARTTTARCASSTSSS